MKLKVEFNDAIKGNLSAKKLFIITLVDEEDTSNTLWLANDENELHDLAKQNIDDGIFGTKEEFNKAFKEDWGRIILYKEIGSIC